MDKFSVDELKEAGFRGFLTVAALRSAHCAEVPREPGVFAVLHPNPETVHFVGASPAGHFKGMDPIVPVSVLQTRWCAQAKLVYIGKADDLGRRVGQLVAFGAGHRVGHWGGRYVWQIADSDALVVAWRQDARPGDRKRQLLEDFVAVFGQLPFANLRAQG